MGEEEPKKPESGAPAEEQPPVKEVKEGDASDKKSPVPSSGNVATKEESKGSLDRDAGLARVETEKRCALIKAWEENEKAKVENKAHKRIAAVGSWENTKKASVDAKIKKYEEKVERKKAEYAEKMKNKVAEIHKAAEQKKAIIAAKRGENLLKIEETAARFRTTGQNPKKFPGCFIF